MAVAFAMSSSFAVARGVALERGKSASLRGHLITYVRSGTSAAPNETVQSVQLLVERCGRRLGVYAGP